MKRIPFFLPLLLLLLAGCLAGKNRHAFDGVSSVYPEVTERIALDAALHLSRAYPPGQTSVALDAQSPFGQALEENLRRQGFTISPTGLQIGYTLDVLQDEASPVCYLSLYLPDGVLAQGYAVSGGLVVPEGVFSKTGLASYSPADDASDVETIPLADEPVLPAAGPAAKVEPVAAPPVASLSANEPLASSPARSPASSVIAAALADVAREMPPAALSPPIPVLPAAPALLPEAAPVESAWTIKPGLLRPQLAQWAASAGYQLVWKADHDFDMESSTIFRDDFEGAIKRLFTRMHLQGNPLRVTVYQANHVLEVVEE
ncbi:MAG: TcpQ domain-containing protein [Desulfovibrio sp.]|jgi:hypothetical protein|nr:TcpQ domain-containing protein [Desulfovibrio sp.]